MEEKIKLIKKWICEALDKKVGVFSYICEKIEQEYEKPCNTILDFSKRTTKSIGDLFEVLCVLYLNQINFKAWLLQDVPDDLLKKLTMVRKDYGIDIVAEKGGEYYAIQCKFKSRKAKKIPMVGWKELSTFYSLCMRSGPWKKMIVMTTATTVRRQGKVSDKDQTIAYKTFLNIDDNIWKKIGDYQTIFDKSIGHKLDINEPIQIEKNKLEKSELESEFRKIEFNKIKPDLNKELREKRLLYLKNIGIIKK
jgi:predicted helicase